MYQRQALPIRDFRSVSDVKANELIIADSENATSCIVTHCDAAQSSPSAGVRCGRSDAARVVSRETSQPSLVELGAFFVRLPLRTPRMRRPPGSSRAAASRDRVNAHLTQLFARELAPASPRNVSRETHHPLRSTPDATHRGGFDDAFATETRDKPFRLRMSQPLLVSLDVASSRSCLSIFRPARQSCVTEYRRTRGHASRRFT